MRKILIVVLLLAIAVLGYVGYAHFTGGAVPTFGLPIGGEKSRIRQATLTFFDKVKFKDRAGLMLMVPPEMNFDDITSYLLKTLQVDLDALDLETINVKHIEVDNEGRRARVRVLLAGHNLNAKKPLDIEKIIFLYRVGDVWLVDIKNLAQ